MQRQNVRNLDMIIIDTLNNMQFNIKNKVLDFPHASPGSCSESMQRILQSYRYRLIKTWTKTTIKYSPKSLRQKKGQLS